MATNFFELATTLNNLGAKWLSEKKINFMSCTCWPCALVKWSELWVVTMTQKWLQAIFWVKQSNWSNDLVKTFSCPPMQNNVSNDSTERKGRKLKPLIEELREEQKWTKQHVFQWHVSLCVVDAAMSAILELGFLATRESVCRNCACHGHGPTTAYY